MEAIRNSPFTNIGAVRAVVKDAEGVAKKFTSLGIGPFGEPRQIFTYHEYKGTPANIKVKFLITSMGEVDFELIQPISGPSIWQDFLERKGEGLHSLRFLVENIDEAEENLTRQGLNIIQKGRSDKGGYAYFDTERIGGVAFDLIQRPKGVTVPQTKAEDNPFAVLHQVASVVKDVDKTIDYYTSLGIGPFRKMKMVLTERWLRGKPIQPKPKLYMTQMGNVEFEPIQPDESYTVHREFLDQKGDGLHHLGFFRGEEIHDEIEKLVKKGVSKGQYGHGPSDAFAYFEPIAGITLEFVKRGPQD